MSLASGPLGHLLVWLVCLSTLVACAERATSEGSPASHDWDAERAAMVRMQLRGRDITDPRVLAVMARIPRHEFVPTEARGHAYEDRPLPIGRDQTISQPYVVALMTQLLAPRATDRVLEIGTGSGYQAAVLSELAREVYTIEIDAHLAAEARKRLAGLGYHNVQVRTGDGFYGWPEAAPFDGVIITAAAPRVPELLVQQLREGGRLVMPLGSEAGQQLVRAVKRKGGVVLEETASVMFVPMTGAIRSPGEPQAYRPTAVDFSAPAATPTPERR